MFNARPEAVGQIVRLNGHPFEIVGVATSEFDGLLNSGIVPTAMWVPIAAAPLLQRAGTRMDNDPTARDSRWLLVKGRLKPGLTLEQAQAEISGIARQLDAAYPMGRGLAERYRRAEYVSRPWVVRRATDVQVNENADAIVDALSFAVVVVMILVLVITCTNLANLMLARSSGRRHEFAVRLAMGAPRRRLVREALAESALLALAGGVTSLAVARLLLIVFSQDVVTAGISLQVTPRIDVAVLGVCLAATLLALAVSGLAPAAQSSRADVRTLLGTEGPGGGRPRWRGRRMLIAAQVAVSLMLLALASLCIQQVRQRHARDSGIDLDAMALVDVDFGLQGIDEVRTRQIVEAITDTLARHPAVSAVAASSGLPMGLGTPGGAVRALDHPAPFRVELVAAMPGIFDVLGVRVAQGRPLTRLDARGAERVAVVSASVAHALFGDRRAIGQQVVFTRARWVGEAEPEDVVLTIVGVADDTDTGLSGRRDSGTIYLPLDQHHESHLVFSVRTSDPRAQVAAIRGLLRAIEPNLAVAVAGTGRDIAGPDLQFFEISGALASALGAFALVLALAGLAGALSHVVAGRTYEIGVRLALGATPRQIMRLIVGDGMGPVISGVVLGLAVGAMGQRALRPLFVRILPDLDPLALVAAPAAIVVAGALACYWPARRAARVDPCEALRRL